MITGQQLIKEVLAKGEGNVPSYQQINAAVKQFANSNWATVKVLEDEHPSRYFTGTTNGLTVNVGTLAGRTMITILPSEQEQKYVSVVGDQTSSLAEYPDGCMGLQDFCGDSVEEVVGWLQAANDNFPELEATDSMSFG